MPDEKFVSPERLKEILNNLNDSNNNNNTSNNNQSKNESKNNTPTPDSSSVPSSAQDSQQHNVTYGDIMALPTQDAVQGIRFDFNSGLRILFPQSDKNYHLMFKDADSGLILYDSDVKSGTIINSVKKYYIRYNFVITRQGTGEKVFEHTLNLKNQKVVVQFPVGTLGDSIGWFSYVERFQLKHQCKLILCISQFLIDIIKKQYPNYQYVKKEEVKDQNMYASYYVGLFFRGDTNYQPMDFRQIGLHRTAAMILGLRSKDELADIPPRIDLSAKRKIKEKYVVIATQASAQAKYWNNALGWDNVITFLRDNGYKVYCIDRERVHGAGYVFNHIPWGVEDDTGDKSLQERIDIIKDADFFIGLPSGLSWLAWCCKVPVVMVSGFSLPATEFYTPYRVINYQGCIGCWDDTKENFDHSDYFWCPRHKGDEHQYECTRIITAEQVINTIKTIPTFRPSKNK